MKKIMKENFDNKFNVICEMFLFDVLSFVFCKGVYFFVKKFFCLNFVNGNYNLGLKFLYCEDMGFF